MEKNILQKETEFVKKFKCKPTLCYGLPEIHRNITINETIINSPQTYIDTQYSWLLL